jgi:hypothetical protein
MNKDILIFWTVIACCILFLGWSVLPSTVRSSHPVVRVLRLLPVGFLIFVAGCLAVWAPMGQIDIYYDAERRIPPDWFYSLWNWLGFPVGIATAAAFIYRDSKRHAS